MINNWINGKPCPADSGQTFDTIDPWTHVAHDTVALSGRSDVERAIDAARLAFDDGPWPHMGFAERGVILVVDDNEDNCRVARSIGCAVVHFDPTDAAASWEAVLQSRPT